MPSRAPISVSLYISDLHTFFQGFQLVEVWLSSRTPNPSIIVRQPIRRSVGDSWASLTQDYIAAPDNANFHRSSPRIEWYGRMKGSDRIRRKDISLITSNLHRHCRRAGEQRREEDLVLNNDIRTCGWLPRRVPGSAVAGPGGGGGETVPEVDLLFCDGCLAGLVCLDVVGEEIAPVVVGHVVYVCLRAVWDTLFFDGANVVGFAVVIPGKNLLCQFPLKFRQVKGCSDILGPLPLQIEAALGAPAANGYATCRPLARPSSCHTGAA